ncbi:MAG: 1-acyl-sn-glycerol-3-phosphate acyltransferase [Gemmatimonadales bacterium]|nr:1-acyl-sn-glycerol-3-phosphate acyltransferase [Gemmatimonadales bacterium]
MTLTAWLLFAVAALLAGGLALWTTRATGAVVRARFRRWARHTVRDFQARIARFKLVSRRAIHDELILDPVVTAAMREHMKEKKISELDVRVRVEHYIDEILPFFNVLSYYKLGYNLAKLTLNLLYKVTIEYQDDEALNRIPRKDVVVYLMNHRSNADYVVVAYVLARGVAVSYAVGEWARVWPLETVFKSFGSYFIRRRYKEPLYHAVLQRYIQLITRHGVTQGIFLEGGLSRDGKFRPAKIGLLDYIVGTVRDEGFDRDIWFVPVAINYDRTLEDRSLIRECLDESLREPRRKQLFAVTNYLFFNTVRFLTGRLKRYGRAAVNFGTPLSLKNWLARQDGDVLGLVRAERLPHVQRLADEVLERIKGVIPVTPVALASAALLSFERDTVPLTDVLERMQDYRDHLLETNSKVVRADREIAETWERARLMFRMRRTVLVEGATVVVMPRQRPLLEYYANSIRHFLPAHPRSEGLMTPAFDTGEIEVAYKLKPPPAPPARAG